MMNEARISVGMGAAMLGAVGYHLSLPAYAKERKQGRKLAHKNPDAEPVTIINHPDVRRMLMKQKAYAEGSVALCLYASSLVDRIKVADAEADVERWSDLLDVLTPMVKSWPSEFGLEANKLAIQVLGGAGYTRDFPLERLYRDNRLNAIHEGTSGMQALDLLGRKAVMHESRAFAALADEIRNIGARAESAGEFVDEARTLIVLLENACQHVNNTRALIEQGEIESGLALASDFLNAMGHVVVGWLLLEQALTAIECADNDSYDKDFLDGKVQVCRYFIDHELPVAAAWLENAGRDPGLLIDLPEESF